MNPSEKKRKAALACSKSGWQIKIWNIAAVIFLVLGIAFLAVGVVCLLIPSPLHRNSVYALLGCGAGSFVFGLIFKLVVLFIKKVAQWITKGEIEYPVSEQKVSKADLLAQALQFNDASDSKLAVEVYGDWIDFTFNWKHYFSINYGVVKNKSIYKKMIWVGDDYTYQELDYEGVGTIDVGLNRCQIESETQMGKLMHHQIEYALGMDADTKDVGIQRYELDTLELTNVIHQWLAERGYTRVA